eukprot:403335658
MKSSGYLTLATIAILSLSSSLVSGLYHQETMMIRRHFNDTKLRITNMSDTHVNDFVYTIQNLTLHNPMYNATNVTNKFYGNETFPYSEHEYLTTYVFQTENITSYTTVTDDQCMFAVKNGKSQVSHVRADHLKVGDSLVIQLHAESGDAQASRITHITKQRTQSWQMHGISTTKGYFIAGTILASDKSVKCPDIKFLDSFATIKKDSKPHKFENKHHQDKDLAKKTSYIINKAYNKIKGFVKSITSLI